MTKYAPRYFALLAICALGACRTMGQPFARLESAVVNDRYDTSPSAAEVRIVRGDSTVTPALALRLRGGDSIATSRNTRAVLTFAAGYEVTLDTGTVVYMEEETATDGGQGDAGGSPEGLRELRYAPGRAPGHGLVAEPRAARLAFGNGSGRGQAVAPRGGSIFLRIGRAFIRKLVGAPDTLDTRTPQAVLHDAGTEYVVSVSGAQTVVRVVTGEVVAESRDGRWPLVRYGPRMGGVLRTDAAPRATPTATAGELEAELGWIRRVERLTKVTVPAVDSLTEQQARDALGRVGLRVLFVLRRESADYAAGQVIETMPAAGERVSPTTYVTLVLAKEPKGEMCTVPNITEKTEAVARRLLAGARLEGQATARTGEIDVVTAQQEKPGSRVRCGSVVHFTLGRIR